MCAYVAHQYRSSKNLASGFPFLAGLREAVANTLHALTQIDAASPYWSELFRGGHQPRVADPADRRAPADLCPSA